MAHEQQLEFIRLVSRHINDKTYQGFQILEIGSYDVNGSIRPFFNGSNYVGVDLKPGPGVDLVAEGNKLDLPNEYFDLAISCECFEHNPNWVDTFKNMYRMTKLGGFVIITCATRGRLEHGTTRTNPAASPGTDVSGWNYYKNLNKSDFEKNLSLGNKFSKYFFYRNKNSADLYFVGKKLGSDVSLDYQYEKFVEMMNSNSDLLKKNIHKDSSLSGRIKDFFRKVTLLPVKIASFFPDKFYQDFVFYYSKFMRYIKHSLFT